MQQIALPSLYAPDPRTVQTEPFPLVRPSRSKTPGSARKFAAGLLFGVLMASTLVLLGYEARIYADQHPELVRSALETARQLTR